MKGYTKKRKKRKINIAKLTRISFLPSVFTMFNLFLGYMALLQVFEKNFLNAAYLIIFSVVVDGFDGTIARLTNTESNFGMQLDSLADAVSFGLVTSFFIYIWGFQTLLPENGKIISFVFLSAGIIRLARFNVYKEVKAFPSNIFIGLPIPLASLCIVSVFFTVRTQLNSLVHMYWFSAFVVVISVLMISNVKYRTIKKIKRHAF